MIIIFSVGAIYHFRIRKQCIYPVKLTKIEVIILIIIPLVFLAMAFYIGEKSLSKYAIAISASMFIISGAVGQGISERGIYYRPLGAAGQIMQLAKWKDIKDIRIDVNKNKLETIKFKSETIFPAQYYNLKDIDEINKYIKMKSKYNESIIK